MLFKLTKYQLEIIHVAKKVDVKESEETLPLGKIANRILSHSQSQPSISYKEGINPSYFLYVIRLENHLIKLAGRHKFHLEVYDNSDNRNIIFEELEINKKDLKGYLTGLVKRLR